MDQKLSDFFLRNYKLTFNMNDLKHQLVHIYAAIELPGAACMPSCFLSSFLLPRLLYDLSVPGVEVGTAEVLAHQLCVWEEVGVWPLGTVSCGPAAGGRRGRHIGSRGEARQHRTAHFSCLLKLEKYRLKAVFVTAYSTQSNAVPWVSSALSSLGGVHIGARALLDPKLIWFG